VIDPLDTGLRHRLQRARERMKGQHGQLRLLLRDAEAAARAGSELGSRLERLRDNLAAHFEVEESIAFPALHGLAPGALAALERLSSDHRAFLRELAELLAGESDAAARVLALGKAIREHEHGEEALITRLLAPDTVSDP
jgi:hypothetical protein